jgi:predicted nucleic acid-binding protein
VIYILDTGPLVAAFRKPNDKDPYARWAASLIRSLPYPLFTCDAVLTEAAHFLRSPAKLIEAINRGLLVSRFDTQAAAPRLAELIAKFSDQRMDFADACLVYMSEQIGDCKVVTIDREDFSMYRRHGHDPIPLLLPDRA